jgi:ubiquinone biosynthesis monooxygenase Coq7
MSLFDTLIQGFDRGLKTLTGSYEAARPNPAEAHEEPDLSEVERTHAAGLMRVNHTGEVCAQALYEGQALTARSPIAKKALMQAAEEERDHLEWCRTRVAELGGRTSVLDPLFFGASFVMGAVTGLLGDKVSLGFVEATEDQVVRHLEKHLDDLPVGDDRSRLIVEQMRDDEARHGSEALSMGGIEFPAAVKQGMSLVAKVMTETTYRG